MLCYHCVFMLCVSPVLLCCVITVLLCCVSTVLLCCVSTVLLCCVLALCCNVCVSSLCCNAFMMVQLMTRLLLGKMFKSTDLPFLVEFLLMFHHWKPVDWLLDYLLRTKVCNPEMNYVSSCGTNC